MLWVENICPTAHSTLLLSRVPCVPVQSDGRKYVALFMVLPTKNVVFAFMLLVLCILALP